MNFPEAALEDFDHVREHVWIDKATGVEYLAVGSDPLAAPNPRSTEVAAFLIDEYNDIVFLRSLV